MTALAVLALPAAAGAQGPDDRTVGVPSPMPRTLDTQPPGLTTTQRQAIARAGDEPADEPVRLALAG